MTYATSPQGADPAWGLTIRATVDPLDPKIQAHLSPSAQINMPVYDTLGTRSLGGSGLARAPGVVRDLVNGQYVWGVGDEGLQELGLETLMQEGTCYLAAAFDASDARSPEGMTPEPMPPQHSVFDGDEGDLDGGAGWS